MLLALRGVGRLLEFGSQVGGEDVAAEIPEKLLESVVNVLRHSDTANFRGDRPANPFAWLAGRFGDSLKTRETLTFSP